MCSWKLGLKNIDKRHRILNKVHIDHHSTTKCHIVNVHPYAYSVNVHANCLCNELVSLHNRHLVDRSYLKFNKKLWQAIARQTLKFYPKDLKPCKYEDVIAAYAGAKKRAYHNAMLGLKTYGYNRKSAVVSMFVKPDRYPTEDCLDKDPRAIQYRKIEYNLELGCYIKPFEHHIYENLTMGVVSDTRVIAKGLNNYERAELMLYKNEYFKNAKYVLLDHSRFDSTINIDHIKTTHRKYQRAFKSRKLQTLLNSQKNNVCYSKGGIKYRAMGTRMSGDPDTGCGNSVVNNDTIWGWMQYCGIVKYDYILDGDDSVLYVESEDVDKLDFGYFTLVGFETKMEIVDNIIQAEFCQSKIIRATRPVLMRNPLRAMSHVNVSRRHYHKSIWPSWLAACGMCEVANNQGVPILQSFGNQLASLSKRKFIDDQIKWRLSLVEFSGKIEEITMQARLDVYEAWGISPSNQLILETHDYTADAFNIQNSPSDNQELNIKYETLETRRFKPWWSYDG